MLTTQALLFTHMQYMAVATLVQRLHLSYKLLGHAGLTLSHDHSMLASISRDKTVKVRHDVCVPGVCLSPTSFTPLM